ASAKPQKSHFALQMFVMANCRYPGPPCWSTSFTSLKVLCLGRRTGFGRSTAGLTCFLSGGSAVARAILILIFACIVTRTAPSWQSFLCPHGTACQRVCQIVSEKRRRVFISRTVTRNGL